MPKVWQSGRHLVCRKSWRCRAGSEGGGLWGWLNLTFTFWHCAAISSAQMQHLVWLIVFPCMPDLRRCPSVFNEGESTGFKTSRFFTMLYILLYLKCQVYGRMTWMLARRLSELLLGSWTALPCGLGGQGLVHRPYRGGQGSRHEPWSLNAGKEGSFQALFLKSKDHFKYLRLGQEGCYILKSTKQRIGDICDSITDSSRK